MPNRTYYALFEKKNKKKSSYSEILDGFLICTSDPYLGYSVLRMNDVVTQKEKLRAEMKNVRTKHAQSAAKKQGDILITTQVLELPAVQDAHTILIYESYPSEVSTKALIEMCQDLGKTVVAPHIESMDPPEMTLRLRDDTRSHVAPSAIECAIIPGLAFDKKLNRLGFGKGFFDRLFHEITCPKIALAYDFQIMHNVPAEKHDEKVSYIITPTTIYEHATTE